MPETPREPGHRSVPGIPRWVKIFIVLFIVLGLLLIILHMLGFEFGGHIILMKYRMYYL
jgi:hypothetical protein